MEAQAQELWAWFMRFVESVTAAYEQKEKALRFDPLFAAGTAWALWQASLSEDERRRIADLARRMQPKDWEAFAAGVRRWLGPRYDPAAVEILLLQLGTLEPFREARIEPAPRRVVPWTRFPAVPLNAGEAQPAEVRSLCAVLRHKEPAQPPVAHSHEAHWGEEPLAQAYHSLRALLGAPAMALLATRGLSCGWGPGGVAGAGLKLAGWLVVAAGLVALAVLGPWLEQDAVLGVVCLLAALGLALAAQQTWMVLHEVRRARRLTRTLETHQLVICSDGIGDGSGRTFVVRDASFSLAASVAMLAALVQHQPPASNSWLWDRLDARLRQRLSGCAFTGVQQGTWRVHPVEAETLAAKHAACVQHPGVQELYVPRQPPLLPGETPKPGVATADSRSGDRLRVHPCRELVTLVWSLGGAGSWQTRLLAWLHPSLAALCLLALGFAAPGVWRIVSAPPAPHFVPWKCERFETVGTGPCFRVYLETERAEAFALRSTLPGHEAESTRFQQDDHNPMEGWAEVRLPATGATVASPTESWYISVVYPVRLLGRPLKGRVVLREEYESLRRAGEEARKQYANSKSR